ncbi:outer membrane beta-barrel protein [Roseivirga sp. BDSF3-8]|uniref:outer membrane beta-barrel protein n=1 Tax=Roseivirga sp. BDSF3-8 TaxID=3241598 RepID=UPI003531DC56
MKVKLSIKYSLSLTTLLICFLLGAHVSHSQARKNSRKTVSSNQRLMQKSPFFDQQWWIGFKGGLTASKMVPGKRHSVFTATPGSSDGLLTDFTKNYDSYLFDQPGTTIGLIGSFSFWKGITLSLQPSYSRYNAAYQNEYLWRNENNLDVWIEQSHYLSLSYLEIPLLVRYDLYRGKVRPYIQAGAYYGHLVKADKRMEVKSRDVVSGGQDILENSAPSIGAEHLFIRDNVGWIAGGGFSYDLGNMRVGLEVNYRQGLENITNRPNRFTDDRLAGVGDVMDDMTLQSWDASFHLTFPLKFLDTGSFVPGRP